MPYYQKRGDLPRKRHMQFRNPEGELYPEHLVGNKGFVGISSLLHHLRPPTTVKNVNLIHEYNLEADPDPRIRHRHFKLFDLPALGDPILGRTPMLFNPDLTAWFVRPHRNQV